MQFSEWSFHRRKGVFYVQFKNPLTGKWMSARSTGTTDEKQANVVVARWLDNGVPEPGTTRHHSVESVVTLDMILAGARTADLDEKDVQRIVDVFKARGLLELAVVKNARGSELLVDFLVRFWTYETSPYVREKRSHNHRIGKLHCQSSLKRVHYYWEPRFAGKRLAEITRSDLKDFGESLFSSGLSAATVNRVMATGTAALRWAANNGLIETNPSERLVRFSEDPEKRGVLTPEEAEALFAVKWDDERARVANLTAAVTGLRSGEVRALQLRDVGQDRLHVRHAWNDVDGLKAPKNGEQRVVPLVPSVRDELLALARSNPHGLRDDRFIFYSTLPDKPCDTKLFLDGLKSALVRLSVGKSKSEKKRKDAIEYWRERGIVYHSWRHYFAARLSDRIDLRRVQLATGHRSAVMAEHYASHALDADFLAVGAAVAESFGNIIPFRKVAANE